MSDELKVRPPPGTAAASPPIPPRSLPVAISRLPSIARSSSSRRIWKKTRATRSRRVLARAPRVLDLRATHLTPPPSSPPLLRFLPHQKLGNDAFSAGKYAEAIEHFTAAIAVDASNHVLYSNRSAAHAGNQDFDAALTDAERTVAMKPDWPKGYSRKGAALHGLRRYDDAVDAYEAGLKLDPASAVLTSGLEDAKAAKARAANARGGGSGDPMGDIGAMLSSPELYGKLATDPSTRGYLAQPDFIAMLGDVQKHPDKFGQYMNDPRMMKVLSVALGVSVMSGEEAASGGFPGAPPATPRATPAPPPPPPPKAPEPEPEPEPELASEKKAALEEKAKGNAAYKAKDFETALKHYDAAIALDDTDISFLTNKAAVLFEKGDYDACVAQCDAAVERGRELRVDYKAVARAMTRKGNALAKKGDLEAAIEAYNKSLMEHRSADTLERKNAAERQLKEARVKAYLDPAKAEEARERGNELFKAQKYPEAVEQYTESIARNPEDHRVYSNRAACYTKLAAFNEALKDAEKCIELKPDFAKGYTRKGHVEFFTKQFDKALETYQEGLKHDPENEELRDGLRRSMIEIQRGSTGQVDEAEMKERQARAMADPEIQGILQDPIMRQVLNDMSTDPRAAAEHQKNPVIMAKIQKLINAGIVQTR